MEHRELGKWLTFVTMLAFVFSLVLAFAVAPVYGIRLAAAYPEYANMYIPALIAVWIIFVPFEAAVARFFMICIEISKDNSFCEKNSDGLRTISRLALADTALCVAALIILLATGLLRMGLLILLLFCVVVGVTATLACAALSRLVRKAYEMKKENDLTI